MPKQKRILRHVTLRLISTFTYLKMAWKVIYLDLEKVSSCVLEFVLSERKFRVALFLTDQYILYPFYYGLLQGWEHVMQMYLTLIKLAGA